MRRLIEFVGLPGSGKSTLVRELELCSGQYRHLLNFRRSDEPGRPSSRRQQLSNILRSVRLKPNLFRALVWAGLKHRDVSIDRMRRLVILAHNLCQIERSTGVWVYDQGPIQAYWSAYLFATFPEYSQIKRVWENSPYPFPHTVVHVQCSPEVAVTRLCSRSSGFSRFDRMQKNARINNLISYESDLTKVMEICASVNSSDVLCVDGTKGVESNVSVILSRLSSYRDMAGDSLVVTRAGVGSSQ